MRITHSFKMGNGNSQLQNDKNSSGPIICISRECKSNSNCKSNAIICMKRNQKKEKKNGERYYTDSIGTVENLNPTNDGIKEALRNDRVIEREVSRKMSPTQQIFLDNIILPLGSEINSRIRMRRNSTQNGQKYSPTMHIRSDNSNHELPSRIYPKHHRAPAGLSRTLKPNVAALIAGSDKKCEQHKYPVVFEYTNDAVEVFLTGSFNNWQKIKMPKVRKPNDFLIVLELNEGELQ